MNSFDISQYRGQIIEWFKEHDPSLANIMAISRNLEAKVELTFEEINLAVVKLLAKEDIISKAQSKEFRSFIQSMKLDMDTFSLKRRKRRSAPMIFGV